MPFWYCPLEKNRSDGGLAAELVLGVVEVGEVLDLRDRHEAGQRRAERRAEDGLLVEQGVEHPEAAEPLPQPARHAVDAALDRDVLAEQQRRGLRVHQVGEGGVDGLRQRHGWPVLGQSAAPEAGALLGGASGLDGRQSTWQGERRHDRGPGREAVLVEHLLGLGHHVLARGFVAIEDVGRRHDAGIHERERRGQQRVAVVVGRDLGGGAVGALGVRAGVTHEPDGAQVQDGGATALADRGQRLGDDVEERRRVRPVGVPVGEPGKPRERGRRPPRRRPRC